MTRKFWLHFSISFMLNMIFWVLIIFNKRYLDKGIWSWIEVTWFIITPVYALFRLTSDGTRWPYLTGLVSSLLVMLVLKYGLQVSF